MDAKDLVRTDLPRSSVFLDDIAELQSKEMRPGVPAPPPDFVVYLTAFLINYDAVWYRWWQLQKKVVPMYFKPKYRYDYQARKQYVRDRFRASSVALSNELQGIPPEAICRALFVRYTRGGGRFPSASRQLLLLFTQLPREMQPMQLMEQLAREPPRRVAHQDYVLTTENVYLKDGFYIPQLLPDGSTVVYDVDEDKWATAVTRRIFKLAPTATSFSGRDLNAIPLVPGMETDFTPISAGILALCGCLACLVTHVVVQPLDMIKTRQQTVSRGEPFLKVATDMVTSDQFGSVLLAAASEAVGYACYGLVIYPSFELGKLWLAGQIGPVAADEYRVFLVLLASTFASSLGCVVTTPWEACKIRITANPYYADSLPGILQRIVTEEGPSGLWAGYFPLLSRNFLFTTSKFFVFDYFTDMVINMMPDMPPTVAFALTSTTLSLLKGALAGCFAAVVSQPADSILTRINESDEQIGPISAIQAILKEQGPSGLYNGVFLRALWASAVISGQFVVYDSIKAAFYGGIMKGAF
uniref:ADP,ATP carrier protein n=1 Tax=Eutreptiella gymnastica TaxID=73025 RepID=A0A7S4FVH4_9EUGL